MTNFIDQEELGMNGDGLETLVTAPKYYWGCCMVCRRTATKSSALKRCAGCSCLYYCSKEHQKLDWRQHKRLCKYQKNLNRLYSFSQFDDNPVQNNFEDFSKNYF